VHGGRLRRAAKRRKQKKIKKARVEILKGLEK
jgi:hypothetical protein